MHKALCTLVLIFACIACGAQTIRQGSDQAKPESKFVTVFGAKIHYHDVGTGPVVVLLHGLADDTTVWDPVVPGLSQNHRVVVLDQIGFGRSDKPMLSYRVATFVDFFHGFLQRLKIERAALIGNSLGGWVAASYALEHPERVDKLVLVDSVGLASVRRLMPLPIDSLRLSSRQMIREALPYIFARPLANTNEVVDAVLQQRVQNNDGYAIEQFIQSFKRREDLLDGRLMKLRSSTLIVWGRSDRLVPISVGRQLQREIRRSKLAILDACGHMPQQE